MGTLSWPRTEGVPAARNGWARAPKRLEPTKLGPRALLWTRGSSQQGSRYAENVRIVRLPVGGGGVRLITDVLIRVAGPDPQELRYSTLERTRYAVMGMSVCVTALFAAGALPAALSLATGQFRPIFLLFGVIWGFFVFNLDRWVISIVDYKTLRSDLTTTRLEYTAFWLRKLALLLIRLAIAVLIGLSIAEPIIMLVYSTEIKAQVSNDQAAQRAQAAVLVNRNPKYAEDLQSFSMVLADAANAKAQAQTAFDKANAALDAEEGGYGGTHEVGVGPRSAERRADLERADNALATATASFNTAQQNYNKELVVIAAQKRADLASRVMAIDVKPGLLDREEALSELAHQYQTVNEARWVLRGLILLVDVSPLLLKVTSPGSVYERLLRVRMAREVSVAEQSLPYEVAADLKIAEYFREGRVAHGRATADEEFRVAAEQLRHETTLRIRQFAGDSPGQGEQDASSAPSVWYLPTGPLPPSEQPTVKEESAGAPKPGQENIYAAGSAPGGAADWSGQFKQNILGLPGSGIYQHVGGRWKIGAQISNADLSLSWRTPYLAEDMLGIYPRVAALKKVHPPNKGRGALEAQQEIMSLPQGVEISPYVAEVIQSGFDPTFGWFVVTPYYPNGTLQRRMEAEPPLTLSRALAFTEQILQGLLDAFTWQDRLLVHMDIKPPNIAFDDDGNVRIIDWGLAAPMNPDYRISMNEVPRYTMWYAPPEQMMPPPDSVWLSPACDIRAVGAVCYAAITGRPPLYLEAYWGGMLDSSGNLKRWSEDDFKKLLANAHPIRIDQFFAVTPGWDPVGLGDLSNLVAMWLDPLPAARIAADSDKPSQQVALERLRRVIQNLRKNHPQLLDKEVGAAQMRIPEPRSADIVRAPATEIESRRPDATTVIRAIPIDPRQDDTQNGAEQ